MIYDLQRGFCLIHIPRTGGVAMTRTLADRCPGAVADLREGRHLRGVQLRQVVADQGGDWDKLHRFAVIRDPWSVVASDYRLTLRDANYGPAGGVGPEWTARVDRLKHNPGFEAFVDREWLGECSGVSPGGLWRTWCENDSGDGLGIQPLLYSDLTEAWRLLCIRLDLEYAPMLRDNAAPGPEPEWTPRLWRAISHLCWRDLELFRF